jgi:hypothetical protein
MSLRLKAWTYQQKRAGKLQIQVGLKSLTHFGAASLFGGRAVSVINSVADLNSSFHQREY